MEMAIWSIPQWFITSTNIVIIDIFFNRFPYPRPPKIPINLFESYFSARVTNKWYIIILTNNFYF